MANGPFHLPTSRLIAIAVVAGLTAGAIGVYVMGGMSGNNAPEMSAADPAAENACAAKIEAAKAAGDAAQGEVAAMLGASPPQDLSGLAFNAPDGAPMTIADLSGKTLLVNLWATWCAPCRHEMPALNQLQKDMGDDRFEVVAVNVDTGDDEKPKRFLEETNVDALGYYRDSTLGLFNDLKRRGLALGLPVTLLIDDEGCMLANMNGPAEWASPDAKRLIDAAM
ncbi:TlpA disulfide reductase family protein [Mesorhizobium sp. CAU 1732]|uniref:thiol:disulfide interchange protein TlpA n=1 Tax=Mesorhizobium sp. CAU 1732 TaxID=3140358 RepID=UPI0032609EB9